MENYRLERQNRILREKNSLLQVKNQQLEDTFNKLLEHSVIQQTDILELENRLARYEKS